MKKRIFNKKGFTLLEIILSLAITGIIAAVAGISFVETAANSFIFAKTNAATLQKGQIAITKILKELNNINAVDSANTNQTMISFTSSSATGNHSFSWGGTGANLLFDGAILTDKVSNFKMAYYDTYNGAAQTTWTTTRTIIEITLVITGANNITSTFTGRVAPYKLIRY
jgi:prepilin-type N-terminal cleavage/methylation domain-containing protein